MKAVIKKHKGKGNMELVEVEKPKCKDDEVLIKIKSIGVCGTDYHIYTDEFDTNPPLIIGHEFSGEIVELGSRVSRLNVGDRVISELSVESCGICRYCRSGNVQMCLSKKCPGIHFDGVFAEYIAMPAKLIHVLPDTVSFEEAAAIEPSAIVAHGLLERTKIEPEDFVVVSGPGPIGLLAAQMAKANGARAVMIVGTDIDENQRLPIAKKLGVDYVVNAQKVDVEKMVNDLTDGVGADIVVECSAAVPAINSAINMVRKQGKMCVIGIPGADKIPVQWKKAVTKAVNIVCCYSSSSESWRRVLSMLDRKAIDLKSLITHIEPLENWESVFKEIEKGNVIKGVLIP